MHTVKVESQPLSLTDIGDWLAELRQQAYTPVSNFAVAVLLEVSINGDYYYFAGVNVESKQHNRASLHAEQTALNLMVTCIGPDARLNRVFFMGALRGEEDKYQDEFCWPCGHCRQILLEFTTSATRFQPIALNRSAAIPASIEELLPNTFSASNLGQDRHDNFTINQVALDFFLSEITTSAVIPKQLALLKPHIIDEKYKTVSYVSIIIECQDKVLIPGVLVQNAAFLTTEAISGAIANAVCRYGTKLKIARIHILHQGNPLNSEISPLELSFARQFGPQLNVRHYHVVNFNTVLPKAKL